MYKTNGFRNGCCDIKATISKDKVECFTYPPNSQEACSSWSNGCTEPQDWLNFNLHFRELNACYRGVNWTKDVSILVW